MRKSYIGGVLDVFSGSGGFSEGFRQAGFKILLGIDNDRNAIRSFKYNFPHSIAIQEDVKEVSGHKLVGLIGGKPDIVIGSPPCEPFTGANPKREPEPIDRLYKDPQGQLTIHFIRLVSELEPKIFVMENVTGILRGEIRSELVKLFRDAGYSKVYFNILHAEDYGVPSHRTRVFVSNIPIKPKSHMKRISVWEAIKDLEDLNLDIPNHEYVSLSHRKQRRISRLHYESSLIKFRGANGRMIPNLIRLHPDKPAPTIMGSSRFIHPFHDRILTVREQARLMGFPDHHVFIGGKDDQFNQVGEAVPPPLAKAVAQEIAKYIL